MKPHVVMHMGTRIDARIVPHEWSGTGTLGDLHIGAFIAALASGAEPKDAACATNAAAANRGQSAWRREPAVLSGGGQGAGLAAGIGRQTARNKRVHRRP
jgi:hypothetical protein